ncbi:NON-SPECIFIC SERINE/THREONINE PROTEIN KINASE, partial [Salix koriyanagi]
MRRTGFSSRQFLVWNIATGIIVVHRDLKPENLLLDSRHNLFFAVHYHFDDESIPNLLRKIKGGIYSIPRYLSLGATDMISKMFVVDPMRRMTMPEIHQHHPWFHAHLPRYLDVPLPDTMQHAKKIDEEILQEVIKLGFD